MFTFQNFIHAVLYSYNGLLLNIMHWANKIKKIGSMLSVIQFDIHVNINHYKRTNWRSLELRPFFSFTEFFYSFYVCSVHFRFFAYYQVYVYTCMLKNVLYITNYPLFNMQTTEYIAHLPSAICKSTPMQLNWIMLPLNFFRTKENDHRIYEWRQAEILIYFFFFIRILAVWKLVHSFHEMCLGVLFSLGLCSFICISFLHVSASVLAVKSKNGSHHRYSDSNEGNKMFAQQPVHLDPTLT